MFSQISGGRGIMVITGIRSEYPMGNIVGYLWGLINSPIIRKLFLKSIGLEI